MIMNPNDEVDFASTSSFNNLIEPAVGTLSYSGPIVEASNSNQSVAVAAAATASSALETPDRLLKQKKHTPKYRATKRPPSERRFQCNHCESRFFTQKDVKRHMVVHTGIRNFACPYCTQRFGRKDHLVRHAKKSHNQDTRSFKRRNRAAGVNAAASSSSSIDETKAKKPNARSRKKAAMVQPNTETTASTATVTTTSLSTNFYPHGNGLHGPRVATAIVGPNYANPTLLMAPASSSLNMHPKMTLVDHASTSPLTAPFTHSRNYPSSFVNYGPSSSSLPYNIANGAFATSSQLVAEASPSVGNGSGSGGVGHYHLPQHNATYLNYDYKFIPTSNVSYNVTGNPQVDSCNFNTSNTSQGSIDVTSTSGIAGSFKSLANSITDGFNACQGVEYSSGTVELVRSNNNNFNPSPSASNVVFGGPAHSARFPGPFN